MCNDNLLQKGRPLIMRSQHLSRFIVHLMTKKAAFEKAACVLGSGRSQWLLRSDRESVDRALAAGPAASRCPVENTVGRLRHPADGIPPIPAMEAVQCG